VERVMATRKSKVAVEEKKTAELNVSREEAKTRLEDRIEKGRELKQIPIRSKPEYDQAYNAYSKWDSFNDELLKRIFTTHELAEEYSQYGFGIIAIGHVSSLGEDIVDLHKNIDRKIHRIDSIIERLELIPLNAPSQSAAPAVQSGNVSPTRSNKDFVVHGRDEVAKTSLEVFLHEIGLEPIVLHRQADQGLTIIEKFEKYSDVGYAFILLTPDEVAYLRSEEKKSDEERTKEFRARPNVIFEFGYFVAKLGRSRVCCLHTGDVALPSDVSGMIYKKFNNSIEEVAYGITKDLKAAGYALG
jgi:predicted nucleotide-binding protein